MPTVAYRVTRGRRKFLNAPQVIADLGKSLDEAKVHFIAEFKKVVEDWEHQVEFAARKSVTADKIKITVYPTGANKDIWKFVTGGTKPHVIRAKNAKTLAFMWGGPGSYQAHTTAPGGYGGPGTVAGGVMHFPKEVQHPGTKARNFEHSIREQEADWFSAFMEAAWKRAIRRL